MVIFDSNIIIDFSHGNEEAAKVIQSYKDKEKAAITVLNKYELLKGRNLDELKIMALINRFKIYDLDNAAIEEASKIYKELSRKGKIVKEFDIFIASIAIANNETLVTKDKRDFQNIESNLIKIVEY